MDVENWVYPSNQWVELEEVEVESDPIECATLKSSPDRQKWLQSSCPRHQ